MSASSRIAATMDKSTDVEVTVPSDELKRTTSITSDSNGNTVIEHGDGETYTIDRAAERRLVWKFDLHILPLLAVMYLFNALDKANLGKLIIKPLHLSFPKLR